MTFVLWSKWHTISFGNFRLLSFNGEIKFHSILIMGIVSIVMLMLPTFGSRFCVFYSCILKNTHTHKICVKKRTINIFSNRFKPFHLLFLFLFLSEKIARNKYVSIQMRHNDLKIFFYLLKNHWELNCNCMSQKWHVSLDQACTCTCIFTFEPISGWFIFFDSTYFLSLSKNFPSIFFEIWFTF